MCKFANNKRALNLNTVTKSPLGDLGVWQNWNQILNALTISFKDY